MAGGLSTRILIAGAGIGGLTAALALRRNGFDNIQVLEQASELREVGAGVQMGPNAVRVLQRLGLADRLTPAAVAPQFTQSRAYNSGRVIRHFPLGDTAVKHYGAPYLHIHRADLHKILAGALGSSHIRLKSKVEHMEQTGRSVTVRLASGELIEGDILIGADGVHSVIRSHLIGPEKPRFSGLVAWRGLAPVERLADLKIDRAVNAWWGPHRHFVHYYVSGGRMMNWVGVVPAGDWRVESWSVQGDKAEALREYDGWHPVVRGIIEATDNPFKWALYDRDPLARWTLGRVTLLGDAAHAMLPFMSQGAAQSIEDGYVLGLCLADSSGNPEEGLQLYEQLRRDRTARVQLGSRANGQTFHLASPWARFVRDIKFRWASYVQSSDKRRQLEWLYRYDCDEVVNAAQRQKDGGARKQKTGKPKLVQREGAEYG